MFLSGRSTRLTMKTPSKICLLFSAMCGILLVVIASGIWKQQPFTPMFTVTTSTLNNPPGTNRLEKLSAVGLKTLSDGFEWIAHDDYNQLDLTASTNESIVEAAVFSYMKRLQIKCPNKIRVGRQEDGGWDVCDAGPFNITKPCLVYSIGMGGEWSFDEMITTKYGCQDMAYDPSIGKPDHKPNPLLWFYNTGLGGSDEVNNQKWRVRRFSTLLKENNHTKATIDILKIDIEYSEWTSLRAMLDEPGCLKNVKQLMIEYHTREMKAGSMSSIDDLLSYWHIAKGLDKLGFKLWTFWDNPICNFVSLRTPGLKLCGCFNAYYVNTRLL